MGTATAADMRAHGWGVGWKARTRRADHVRDAAEYILTRTPTSAMADFAQGVIEGWRDRDDDLRPTP